MLFIAHMNTEQYKAEAELLEERLLKATAGTQKLHSFIPVNDSTL